MASLLDSYEQQYAILTADITAKIGKISLLIVGERKNVISDVERHVEEAQELLEQMELEVREADASARPKLRTRLESYRAELKRLSQEFSKARSPSYQDGFGEDGSIFGESTGGLQEEQHQRLLDNSERIERTGRQLSAGYRIALETEEIGTEVLRDLHTQRETIQRARSRNMSMWSQKKKSATRLVADPQNPVPVTDLATICQNQVTHYIRPSELLDFDERRPSQLLDFDESATKQVAAFFQDHIDVLFFIEFYLLKANLRETDAELGRSSRILNTMIARSIQHRVVLFVVAVALCGTAIFGIYLATSR